MWLLFYFTVLTISTVATVRMSFYMRDMRRENVSLVYELAAMKALMAALLERTNGMVACDGCGKPIVEEQAAAVRITPGGPMFGHVMCLPPMPDET